MSSRVEKARILALTPQLHFNHLLNNKWRDVGRWKRMPKVAVQGQVPKVALPRNRIPAWNIAPGDRVLVLKGDEGIRRRIGTVAEVDRLANRLTLQEGVFMDSHHSRRQKSHQVLADGRPPPILLKPRGIRYGNVALVLDKDPEAEIVRVATRIKAKRLRYDYTHKRWVWQRFPEQVRWFDTKEGKFIKEAPAVASTSKASSASADADTKFEQASDVNPKAERVTWPNEVKKAHPPYDLGVTETLLEAVQKDSFQPEVKPWKRLLPELQVPYLEFGNPISKARRQELWNLKNRTDDWRKIKRNQWTEKPLLKVLWPREKEGSTARVGPTDAGAAEIRSSAAAPE